MGNDINFNYEVSFRTFDIGNEWYERNLNEIRASMSE